MNTARSGARVTVATLQTPASKNADFTGTGLDLSGYEGVIDILIAAKNVSGTTPTLTLSIKDSADNSSFAATGAKSTTGETLSKADDGTNVNVLFRVDVAQFGQRKYIAVDGDLGGTTPVFIVGAWVIGQKKYPS